MIKKKQTPGEAPQPARDREGEVAADRAGNRSRRLRLRAAWMYFVEEMTQQEIAEQLGVGRVTVVRLLTDARERAEVKFRIEGGVQECIDVARDLEKRFGIEEAIVVPMSRPDADATIAISAATGMYLSDLAAPGLRIGVGWGRTLLESLSYVDEAAMPGMSVVSLLGGITKVRQFNPSEFAWRVSNLFQAECFLMTAPAIVDSPATKRALIERCGLGEVFEKAQSMDAVVFSVGGLDAGATPYRHGFLPEELRKAMLKQGAVGEFLFNYFDAQGRPVKSSISDCVMTVPLKVIADTPQRILASGGVDKSKALLGAIRGIRPTVLVTDEFAARQVLELDRSAA